MNAYPLPRSVLCRLEPLQSFVLLETRRFDRDNFRTLVFTGPVARLRADTVAEVRSLFARAGEHLARGHWLAGLVAYEAAAAFEECLPPPPGRTAPGRPLALFLVFPEPLVFDHRRGAFSGPAGFDPAQRGGAPLPPYRLADLRLDVTRSEYLERVRRAGRFIAAGDTYQVNYTVRQFFRFSGSALRFYDDLSAKQSVSYAAFIRDRDLDVLSLSPELFFRRRGDLVVTRPMKGTAPRGLTGEQDRRRALALRRSAKNRAENLMIVDLLRNDLGRLAVPGGVSVDSLFDIERYGTLFQMTSTISARLQNNPSPEDFFRALFPCGSVTGAPKLRTMEIIRALEKGPRGVYTGAVGFMAPDGEMVFNVPIRTVCLRRGRGEMGIGGGIVADSDPAREYDECRLKALFLTRAPLSFRLIETIGWSAGDGYLLLEGHLERLGRSARYFGFPFPAPDIRRRLRRLAARLDPGLPWRVRLLLDREGRVRLGARPLEPVPEAPVVALSPRPVDSGNLFLYHKTTRRGFYTGQLRRARSAGFYDYIFRNERGELTEGAIHNLFVEQERRLYTPPVSGGLLPGVLRASLLADGRARVKTLRRADLEAADAVFMGNSVRGLVRVTVLW